MSSRQKGDTLILCTEYTLVKQDGQQITAVPLYCNRWSCEICQPRRQAQLKFLARAGKPNTFMTLTVNPKWRDNPTERAQALRDAFQKLVKRIKRKYGYKRLPYLAVFERTKRGEPHLHILLRCKWIDQRWLSRQMAEMINAPIVDIRRVWNTQHAATYISKYIGKDPVAFTGCKRYWKSRDYDLRTTDDDTAETHSNGVWEVRELSLEQYADMMTALGHNVSYTPSRVDIEVKKPPWVPWHQQAPGNRTKKRVGA